MTTPCSVPDCAKPASKRGWCAMHYGRWLRHGTLADPKRPDDRARFMSYVTQGTGCWLWTGRLGTGGYAYFAMKCADGRWRPRRAHRVAYELFVGPIPDGLALDHMCEVRHCVNPDHLRPSTWRDNTLRNTSPVAANARRTECLRGHPLAGDNVQIIRANGSTKRRCKACAREARAARRARPGGTP